MNVVPFLKPEKILEYLDVEVERSLRQRGVQSWSAYAWADEDTPSDEYIGLAKWELDSADNPIVSGWDNVPVEVRDRMVQLVSAGEDLRGLIEMSRKSIGLTIVFSELAKKAISNLHDPFWIHYLNTMTLLNMASDRLRDVFLMGCFKQTAKEYKRGKPDEAKYFSYPFTNTDQISLPPEYDEDLLLLGTLTQEIYELGIKKRNSMVHELASELGRLAKDTAGTDLREFFDSTPMPSFENSKKAWISACKRHEAEIENAVKSVIEWHQKLMKAVSITFDIEHILRKSKIT